MLALTAAVVAMATNTATLHVGVHRDAGGIRLIAADGASGQCDLGPSRISCPASGPVTFRWAGDGAWTLYGDTVVSPEQTGTAWVLASEDVRLDQRALLTSDNASYPTILSLFTREGDTLPEAPSLGMLEDLAGLLTHSDPWVRRAIVEALFPWLTTASWGPLPPSAPIPLPDGLLYTLSMDPDKGVRRRVAAMIKEVRPSNLSEEAAQVLRTLERDRNKQVRRAVKGSTALATANEALPAEESWWRAMRGIPQEGGPGRLASATLARLHRYIDLGESPDIDPAAGLEMVIEHHPEKAWKVWTAWRQDIPFYRPWFDTLLRDTHGLSPALLQYWSQFASAPLADAIERWEPEEPHSAKFQQLQRLLADAHDPSLRAALELGDREPATP